MFGWLAGWLADVFGWLADVNPPPFSARCTRHASVGGCVYLCASLLAWMYALVDVAVNYRCNGIKPL